MHRNLVESVDVWIAGNFELQASSNVQRLLEIKTVCRRFERFVEISVVGFHGSHLDDPAPTYQYGTRRLPTSVEEHMEGRSSIS